MKHNPLATEGKLQLFEVLKNAEKNLKIKNKLTYHLKISILHLLTIPS